MGAKKRPQPAYPNVLAAIPHLPNGEINWAAYPPILGYTSYHSLGFPIFTHDHPCYSTQPEYFDGWPVKDLTDVARALGESALKSMEKERNRLGKAWPGYAHCKYPEQEAIVFITGLIGQAAKVASAIS